MGVNPRKTNTNKKEPCKGDTKNMANSYSQIYIHTTFHVKEGCRIDKTDLPQLCKYISGIVESEGGVMIAAGGVSNHIHLLLTLPRTVAVSDYIRKIKANSSRWIKELGGQYRAFSWQDGFGVFSVSPSVIEKVVAYINNQEEHHKKHTYKDEMISFLNAYHVQYDERYV